MTKLRDEMIKAVQDVFPEPVFENDEDLQIAIAAEKVAKKYIAYFKEWYDKLSPAEKCTVWPPAGSGAGTGLYNMETEDLVDKFLSKKTE